MAQKRPRRKKDSEQERMLEQLDLFERFQSEILPALQADVAKGVPAEELARKFQSHAAARAITIALTEPDSAKALAATKDILDRAVGKAVERKKVQHELAELTDEQLDALIKSVSEENKDGDTIKDADKEFTQ